VIFGQRLDQAAGGPDVDPDPVWAEWNAKDPEAKAVDALQADRSLIERLDALSDEQRSTITISFGPTTLDLEGMLRLRLAEHVLHRWDIDVAFVPAATLDPELVPAVLEILPMISGFAGKPTGSTRDVRVRTTSPELRFVVRLTADGATVHDGDSVEAADVELPAEALVRLVYGRLAAGGDDGAGSADLEELRRAFPGI
jgi:uncharacterized protein (TIGR03083 family)